MPNNFFNNILIAISAPHQQAGHFICHVWGFVSGLMAMAKIESIFFF